MIKTKTRCIAIISDEPRYTLNSSKNKSLGVLSEVLLDDIQSLGFLTEVLDDNNRTAANLTGLAFFVDLAQTRPFTEFLVGIDTDQRDLMLMTEGSNELLVIGFVKRLSQDTQNSLTPGMGEQTKLMLVHYLIRR